MGVYDVGITSGNNPKPIGKVRGLPRTKGQSSTKRTTSKKGGKKKK